MKLIDDNDQEVAIGEIGELLVRGSSTMKGYWNQKDETLETLRGGWLHTGDLFQREENGFLRMIDRKKYLIKTGGENVYPREVEEVLLRHEAVVDCAIIGIPDKDWGESLKAYIVLDSKKKVTKEELIDWCKQSIASYKTPRFIKFRDVIPRNHSGKVLKDELH